MCGGGNTRTSGKFKAKQPPALVFPARHINLVFINLFIYGHSRCGVGGITGLCVLLLCPLPLGPQLGLSLLDLLVGLLP